MGISVAVLLRWDSATIRRVPATTVSLQWGAAVSMSLHALEPMAAHGRRRSDAERPRVYPLPPVEPSEEKTMTPRTTLAPDIARILFG
jgi:hypothetical protein